MVSKSKSKSHISSPAKAKTKKEFGPSGKKVSANLEEVYKTTEIPDSDSDLDWLSDYSHDAANGFIEEWSKNEEIQEVPEAVREAILFKIEENTGKDWWDHHRSWLLGAIARSAEEAERLVGNRAQGSFGSIDEDKGIVSVVVQKPFLTIWRAAVEGVGYAAWGGDEKISNVESLTMVLNILDEIAEVYGSNTLKRNYENEVDDRYEPETGMYGELARFAAAEMKKA